MSDRFTKIAVICIIALGAWLRLRDLNLTAFNIDEAIAAIYSIQFAWDGVLPTVGVKTSLYFYNSPLLIYLLAPFFSISTSPVFAQTFVAFIGIALIVLISKVGKETLPGPWYFAVALIVALSPFCILTSRRLWGHSFQPFLAAFVFYHTWQWAAKGRERSLFFIPLGILWAQKLHFSGTLLWLDVAIIWLIFKPHFAVRYFTAGFTIGALPYFPYLIDTGLADLTIIVKHIFHGADSLTPVDTSPISAAYQFLGDLGRNDMLGETRIKFLTRLKFYSPLSIAGGALLATGVMMLIWELRHFHSDLKKTLFPIFCLVWLCVPLFAFIILNVTFVPYYLLPALPAPFLIVVYAMSKISRAGKHMWILCITFLALWSAGQVIYTNQMYTDLFNANMTQPLQTCLRYQEKAIEFIIDESKGEDVQVIQSARPIKRGVDYSYNYLLWRKSGKTPTRFFNNESYTRVLLIHDSKDKSPEWFNQWIPSLKQERFGNVTVYSVERDDIIPAAIEGLGLNQ